MRTALVIALLCACDNGVAEQVETSQPASTSARSSSATTMATRPPAPTATPGTSDAVAPKDGATLVAGGDVYFGRDVGQLLLARGDLRSFERVQSLLDSADIRFANLECQLSDQNGVTVHPDNRLVFNGPPAGADVLGRARFDIVSLANNHMWDFGKDALFETFANLERVGIEYVGAGRQRRRAYAPVVVNVQGFRVAFVAATDIWNQGVLRNHPAKEYVARADPEEIAMQVRRARSQADAVVVSYHGGSEYMEQPTQVTRKVLHAAIDAGADIVIGHHPHVAQGIGWYAGKPILYSLGNFTMGGHSDHPWSLLGYLARIRFVRGKVPEVEACPFRIHVNQPVPLSNGAGDQKHFFMKLGWISKHVAASDIGEPGADGCAPISAPAVPFPGAVP